MSKFVMPPVKIDAGKCICSQNNSPQPWPCIVDCPGDCIERDKNNNLPTVSYPDECWYCGNCVISCPGQALEIVLPLAMLI